MRPEFQLPNLTTKLKNKEVELLDAYIKDKLERQAQREAEEAAALKEKDSGT